MSTNQLFLVKQDQKTATAAKSKTAISQEQSQKLLQTMLTMSFGCLAFLRGLFPDEYFLDQRFVPEKTDKNYDKTKQTNSIKIKTLIRGKSKEIDLLLDWLEKGVFQSIKLKYLKALSLGIFLDENKPSELTENYIFTFNYDNENGDVSMSIDNTQFSKDKRTEVISLKDSRRMVQQLMRRFIIITQSLEPLPDSKFLSMRLLFNDNVDPKYQPPLFKDATFQPKTTIKIPKGLGAESFNIGEINTGLHQCQVGVLSSYGNCNTSFENNDNDIDMSLQEYQEIDPLQQIIDMEEGNISHNLTNETSFSEDSFQEKTSRKFQNIPAHQESQTSNILGDFLNSSRSSVLPTQFPINTKEDVNLLPKTHSKPSNELTCECNIKNEDPLGGVKSCMKCGREVHNICYGNTKNSRFHCFTCIYQGTETKRILDTNNRTFHRLMVLRKVYRAINKLYGKPPTKFTQFMSRIFDTEECEDKQNIEDFVFALNCLFWDNTLHLRQKNEAKFNKRIFCEMLADIPGVKTKRNRQLELNESYPLTVEIGNRNGGLCYMKITPKFRQEIEEWIFEVQNFERHLQGNTESQSSLTKDNEENIISLSSLAIQDSETQDPIKIGVKRKGMDLDQYLDTKENSLLPETFNMKTNNHMLNNNDSLEETQETTKKKIRKISISKGTVKSNW